MGESPVFKVRGWQGAEWEEFTQVVDSGREKFFRDCVTGGFRVATRPKQADDSVPGLGALLVLGDSDVQL
jgi:hypothetical protein